MFILVTAGRILTQTVAQVLSGKFYHNLKTTIYVVFLGILMPLQSKREMVLGRPPEVAEWSLYGVLHWSLSSADHKRVPIVMGDT